MGRASKKKTRQWGAKLRDHRREGKILKAPLAELPIRMREWVRDDLPDFLWLDSVLAKYGLHSSLTIVAQVLDTLDEFVPAGARNVLEGTIHTFALVPETSRSQAIEQLRNHKLYDAAFSEEFRNAVLLYEDCPASWVADGDNLAEKNPHSGIDHLRGAIERLRDRHGESARQSAMFVLHRWMKHRRFHTLVNDPHWKLFPRWPTQLKPDERRDLELFGRSLVMASRVQPDSTQWAATFWRRNLQLSACELERAPTPMASADGRDATAFMQSVDKLIGEVRESLQTVMRRIPLDLYSTDRDDVLSGLASRQFRLFEIAATDPSLWIPETGNIFRRLMADTLILLAWLWKRNNPELFARYKTYSLGRLKLYKLKLEEASEAAKTQIDETLHFLQRKIEEEIFDGALSIDLGKVFEKMDARKMAAEVGLESTYHFEFAPASADVHGEWVVLKDFYLRRCTNPLHRWHYLPDFESRGIFVFPSILVGLAKLFEDSVRRWLIGYNVEIPAELNGIADRIRAANDSI